MTDEQGRPMRILIVEDEPVIAFELEQTLIGAGFEIVGVAGRLEEGLAIVESGALDAAVVDANLHRVSAAPIATALTARGLPFIVTTGYFREQLPVEFQPGTLIEKPCCPEQLIETLRSLLEPQQMHDPLR